MPDCAAASSRRLGRQRGADGVLATEPRQEEVDGRGQPDDQEKHAEALGDVIERHDRCLRDERQGCQGELGTRATSATRSSLLPSLQHSMTQYPRLLIGRLEHVHHQRPGQMEVRRIDIRVLRVRPVRPVGRVRRQPVEALRIWMSGYSGSQMARAFFQISMTFSVSVGLMP